MREDEAVEIDEELRAAMLREVSPSFIEEVKNSLNDTFRKQPAAHIYSSWGETENASLHRYPELRIVDRANEGYYALIVRAKAHYLVKYEQVPALPRQPVTRISIWRNRSVFSAGFSTEIFFEYLLPRFSALMSDQLHTEQGAAFWQHRCLEAFQCGLHVHVYLCEDENRIRNLNRMQDLAKFNGLFVPATDSHKRASLIIANKALEF